MGIILVYDITSAKTFENITKWLRNIDEVKDMSNEFSNFCLLHFVRYKCVLLLEK